MTHTWPGRTEWQADAEQFQRTLVFPRERVPSRADYYLNADELAEIRATAHRLAVALRRTITASITPLAKQFPDEPARRGDRYGWSRTLDEARSVTYERLARGRSDRLQLSRAVRELDDQNLTVRDADLAGRDIGFVAARWNTDDTATDSGRLARLLAAMTERCDTAADEATEAAVQAEIAKRASDAGWAKELRRREDLDSRRTALIFH